MPYFLFAKKERLPQKSGKPKGADTIYTFKNTFFRQTPFMSITKKLKCFLKSDQSFIIALAN
jgi:hypothetical protein